MRHRGPLQPDTSLDGPLRPGPLTACNAELHHEQIIINRYWCSAGLQPARIQADLPRSRADSADEIRHRPLPTTISPGIGPRRDGCTEDEAYRFSPAGDIPERTSTH